MQNSRSLWPTQEELRQHCELMDSMMETRGLDVLEALRVDDGLASIAARAGDGPRGSANFCPNAAFFRLCRSIESRKFSNVA